MPRDVLDELGRANRDYASAIFSNDLESAEVLSVEIARLLAIIRRRLEAGDECAFYLPIWDSRHQRHAASVKECEEAVK